MLLQLVGISCLSHHKIHAADTDTFMDGLFLFPVRMFCTFFLR